MKVYKGIAALEKVPNGSVVTIGNFDGVHRGHREILRRAAERSRQLQLPAIAITFRPHPHIALHPVGDAHLLNSYEEKLELLSDLGLDMVVEEPFSREFSNTSPQDFFQHYLVDKLKVKTLILGYDFSFGKERAGSLDVMQELTVGHVSTFRVENPTISK
jgi:riboflavin kinase/FMN adenylyltransferase